MRKFLLLGLVVIFTFSLTSAQSNKLVYGPLVGDDAGYIYVESAGDAIEVEMWVRTDPGIEGPFYAVSHHLMTENAVIATRGGVTWEPPYDMPNWAQVFVDGPFFHDESDNHPIPEGHTNQAAVGVFVIIGDPVGEPLDTGGAWDLYGTFSMVTNEDAEDGQYNPFSSGWYPHSGQGTDWAYEAPPGGNENPEEDYATVFIHVTAVDDDDILPVEFSLAQNYPNPFNASTTIEFSLPEAGDVSIQIYDILGRSIETLISGAHSAGTHSIVWHADNQPSGVYFYRIQAGNYSDQKSCLILK